MKKKYKQRIARLAIALLRAWDKKKGCLVPPEDRVMGFRMSRFSANPDHYKIETPGLAFECGTTCCFAGYAPFVMPYTRRLNGWGKVMEFLTGRESLTDDVNNFLFGASWDDVPLEAAQRALYLLEKGPNDLPGWMGESELGLYRDLTERKVLSRLEKFL